MIFGVLVSVGVGMTRVGMTRMVGVGAGVLVGAAVGVGFMTRMVGVGAGFSLVRPSVLSSELAL